MQPVLVASMHGRAEHVALGTERRRMRTDAWSTNRESHYELVLTSKQTAGLLPALVTELNA